MTTKSHIDKNEIVVGQPLPFSVYGVDNTLLLAEGQLVESERVRESLIRNGVLQNQRPAIRSAEDQTALETLSALRQDYANLSSRSRFGLRMAREDSSESYLCWVVGHTDKRGLMITAPCREDRSLVAVAEGHSWLFRTFYATAAFRFSATIQKVLFEPFPYLHIKLPQMIDMRSVRKLPRSQACVNATVVTAQESPALIADMSACGLRIAMDASHALAKDQKVSIEFAVSVLERQHNLKIQGRVVSCYGAVDAKHPRAHFYGVALDALSETDQLIMHGFVQQQLVNELDQLWHTLALDARSA